MPSRRFCACAVKIGQKIGPKRDAIGNGPVKSHVAQSCYSVIIGDKPFLWSKAKFDLP